MLKKFLRYVVLTFTGIVAFIVIFVFISVAPVDRTPASQLASSRDMLSSLRELEVVAEKPGSVFSVGYGKTNITPAEPVAMAGYGKRKGKSYQVVHDSIYVRTMVITNANEKIAIVSADLLLIPPTVTRILPEKLAAIGFSLDNTYLSATHSHNSIGQWSEGATRFIYGPYDDAIVNLIADGIVRSIIEANGNVMRAEIKTGSIAIPQAVENRLIDGG
ncbi:MAG TPA: neutral/alkaline non-lysosomal ceramidase N-terminal domain-containing protein, partial [Ohtaekwangia sp.]|nr:neutral/alkaline non-lysosomal ceramidase N-terminal domain-containing protein [Ohtaekwangia sp.]